MGLSLWYAPSVAGAYIPLIATMARVDGTFGTVSDNGGGTIKLHSAGLQELTVGDVILVYGAVYSGSYTVVSSTTGYVIITAGFISADVGYIIATPARPNWYANIELQYFRAGSLDWIDLATIRARVGVEGYGMVDYRGYLNKLFIKENMFKYDRQNQMDANYCVGWRRRSQELWDDSDSHSPESPVSAWGNTRIAICASPKLQDELIHPLSGEIDSWKVNDNNLLKYVWVTDDPSNYSNYGDIPAPFYTEFEEMRFFEGYPFDLQIVIHKNDPLVYFDTYIRQVTFSINGIKSAELLSELTLPSGVQWLQRIMLSKEVLSSDVHNMEVAIVKRGKDISPIDDTIYELSETKIVRVDKECSYDAPIYLSWLNRYSGTDGWLFGLKRRKNLNVDEHVRGKANPINYLSDPTLDETITKQSKETFTLSAYNIRPTEIDGLKSILKSSFVQMLMNPEEFTSFKQGASPTIDPVWMTVVIKEGSFDFGMHDQTRFKVEFDIELPTESSQTI